jgi:hypothetical protein
MQAGTMLAFHFSIPFLFYDFVYLRLFKGLAFSYLLDYWYLTSFSIVPWVLFPWAAAKALRSKGG